MLTPTFMAAIVMPLLLVPSVTGHEGYRKYIPNGYSVRNPCTPDDLDDIWETVGHLHADVINDGTERSMFGKDFLTAKKAEGFEGLWVKLCSRDSDRDGRTNGKELGDPDCTWVFGNPNPIQEVITHPGIPDTADGVLEPDTEGKNYCP